MSRGKRPEKLYVMEILLIHFLVVAVSGSRMSSQRHWKDRNMDVLYGRAVVFAYIWLVAGVRDICPIFEKWIDLQLAR